MEQYSGLCVGGPSAGTYLTHYAPVYQVAVMPPLDFILSEPSLGIPEKVTYQCHIYLHRKYECEGQPLEFWVEHQMRGWSLLTILRHIMQNYRPDRECDE